MATTLQVHTTSGRSPPADSAPLRNRNSDGHAAVRAKFRREGEWLYLQSTEAIRGLDPLRGQLGKPGLWKFIRNPHAGTIRAVFELPRSALQQETDDDEAEALEVQCLEWAYATARGHVPEGWEPRPREEVLNWLPLRGLTLQTGPHLRQGTVLHGPKQLALRMPILPSIPDSLPPGRREWMEELLLASQGQWRLVRAGFTDAGGIEAEVNLAGAPHGVLEPLTRIGLDSLRWVVERLMEPMVLLADPSLSSRALETIPARAQLARKEEGNGHP